MRAAKVDRNQKEITEALRSMGCSVYPTHMVGRGFPDLVVGYNGKNYLLEVKDGTQPPSRRRLTADEKRFYENWKGRVNTVNSVEECIIILGLQK